MTQVECPSWLRPTQPDTNYESAPPPASHGRSGFLFSSLMVGEQANVMAFKFFTDDRGNLWVSGRACLHQDINIPLVERTADGIRVLSWPEGERIDHAVHLPNRYGLEDIHVVEFPEVTS